MSTRRNALIALSTGSLAARSQHSPDKNTPARRFFHECTLQSNPVKRDTESQDASPDAAHRSFRRKLVLALGASSFSLPCALFAQKPPAIPRVGVLALELSDQLPLFRDGLLKLGYVEGRNIRLEVRKPGDRYAQLDEIAKEFVRLKVDVIVAFGGTVTIAAKKSTATIPIVMVSGIDVVREGLAASLARPGGNLTGIATILQELSPKRLELAKDVITGLTHVGILWNPDSHSSTLTLDDTQKAAKALALQLQPVEVRNASEFDQAFGALARSRISIFVLGTSSMFGANQKRLLDAMLKHRMAGIFPSVEWVDGGGLMSYGPSRTASYRHAAAYVDKILKGASPSELPIEQPTKIELAVNMKAAKALGIKIPHSVLVRADRVIE